MAGSTAHLKLQQQTEPAIRVGLLKGKGGVLPTHGWSSTTVLAVVLALSACATETPPTNLGTDTIPVISAPASTAPAETTTTIDFDAPNDQVITALSEEPSAAEVAEVADNIRGLTTDSTAQMNRLAPFVDLISARTAKILDFGVSVSRLESNKFGSNITMAALAPHSSTLLAGNLDDELRANGWNRASQETQSVESGERLTRSYHAPGIRSEDLELTIVVTDGAGATNLELMYATTAEDNENVFDQLTAWQDAIPLPRAAEATNASLTTAADEGSLSVSYEVSAKNSAEAREAMLSRLSRAGYEVTPANDDSEGSTEPLHIVDKEGTPIQFTFESSTTAETVEMSISTTFALSPVD